MGKKGKKQAKDLAGRGVWGRMDTHICMAESLCCLPETITALLISYIPIENKKLKINKDLPACRSDFSFYFPVSRAPISGSVHFQISMNSGHTNKTRQKTFFFKAIAPNCDRSTRSGSEAGSVSRASMGEETKACLFISEKGAFPKLLSPFPPRNVKWQGSSSPWIDGVISGC